MIERLEVRRLLAAVFYDDDSTSVKVTGTSGDDVISIVRRDTRLIVTLNGVKRTFDRAKVTWVDVQGGDGNDLVDARYTDVSLHAWGGSGRDTLVGGWGDDHLFGVDNPDRLIGNAGNDRIDGGGGRDAIFGGDGGDRLSGDGGDDRVFGDAGDDDITDLHQRDAVDGGTGADWLTAYKLTDTPAHTSIEGRTLLHLGDHADPVVHLHAIRRKDGQFAVIVIASHGGGGYDRIFGDMTRNKRTFNAFVTANDLAGPDAGRTMALETERQTYILGRLADGTYTFNAGNEQRLLATVTIRISGGRLVNTPPAPPLNFVPLP